MLGSSVAPLTPAPAGPKPSSALLKYLTHMYAYVHTDTCTDMYTHTYIKNVLPYK